MNHKLTSRKLWLAVYFEHLFFFGLVNEWIPTEAFVSLTYLVLGGYFLGNVATKYLQPKTEGSR